MATTKTPAATKPPAQDDDYEKKVITPEQQANSYMVANKADHYNFEDSVYYKVPSSSITLTTEMGGGLPPGAHRAVGITRGGKTSCLLDFMYHFLKVKGRRGFYVKAEGRLSPEVMARSGLAFVTDPKLWTDGTCLIFESNVYEAIFGFMGDLIRNNPTKTKYFFILDSMDMISRREDLAKGLDKAQQVAGGALITSTFLKQTSIALEKRGHVAFFISQVREEIKGQYDVKIPRQGGASGGHALEHQGTWVFEFRPRWDKHKIKEGDAETGKTIGHYCVVKILKSTNEKDDKEVQYPIKYGRTNATSVWVERELVKCLIWSGWLAKTSEKSAWLAFSPAQREEIKTATGVELPEKVQGEEKAFELLEQNPAVVTYLFECFRKLASGEPF